IINNAGIYTPETNEFQPLDLPRPPDKPADPQQWLLNDMFCSGHLHLPDGNVLFLSGTQFYDPFNGAKTAYIFDWKKQQWIDAGRPHDGHWYPNMVPLEDGRLVAFGGYSYKTPNNSSVMSPYIEIFDPARFDPTARHKAWSYVDARELQHSPWQTPLWPGGVIKDTFMFYPRNVSLPDGRILLTRNGAGGNPGSTRNTYLVRIGPRPTNPGEVSTVTFVPGPERPDVYRTYGTAVVDPTNGNILLIGGQKGPRHGSPGNLLHGPSPYDEAGVTVTADLDIYHLPDAEHPKGHWEQVPNFLGDTPFETRMMHYAVILPTKQILVVDGGNFSYQHPVFFPQLLTPDATARGGYRVGRMNEALQPRLYHSGAFLLPDGRVFTVSGNASRASYDIKEKSVDLSVYQGPPGMYFRAEKGQYKIPAEIWVAEIFSPPYLFLPGLRPEIGKIGTWPVKTGEADVTELDYGQNYTVDVTKIVPSCALSEASLVLIKLGSVTHSWDSGQRLIDLAIETVSNALLFPTESYTQKGPEPYPTENTGELVFTAPKQGPTTPPGFYMMFYVDCRGKPSKAKMVQLTPRGN
ncbi:MAG: galactose oxidase early set domain-containing protein, partial [bacterium]|nr:galactose oxidase early set domain-containing protein [bacterium]